MAENQEKTEAEILEETMQNLGLEEDDKSSSDLENVVQEELPLESESLEEEKLIDEEEKLIEEVPNDSIEDEITAVDDINLNNNEESVDNSSLKNEQNDLEIDDNNGIQKKQTKLHKILIIILGVLFTIVLSGAVLYFTGFFDPEPIVEEVKSEKELKAEKEKYEFNEEDIDSKRLNKKLNLLTKYEIVENSDMEAQKAQEKENLYLEAKRQLEAERQAQIERIKEAERQRLNEQLPPVDPSVNMDAKIDKEIENVIEEKDKQSNIQEVKEEITTDNMDNQENLNKVSENNNETLEENKPTEVITQISNDTTIETSPNNEMTQNEQKTSVEESQTVGDNSNESTMEEITKEVIADLREEKKDIKTFVKVIKITTNKKDIYKSLLDKVLEIDTRVSLCRDDRNLVEIFVGPFDDEMERFNITKEYKETLEIDVEAYDYTQEEYDKRCNY